MILAVASKPTVRQIAQDLLTRQTIAAGDVDGLLSRASEDGRLSSTARKHIRMVIVARLEGFLDIRRPEPGAQRRGPCVTRGAPQDRA